MNQGDQEDANKYQTGILDTTEFRNAVDVIDAREKHWLRSRLYPRPLFPPLSNTIHGERYSRFDKFDTEYLVLGPEDSGARLTAYWLSRKAMLE
jgi:hypothetical protein